MTPAVTKHLCGILFLNGFLFLVGFGNNLVSSAAAAAASHLAGTNNDDENYDDDRQVVWSQQEQRRLSYGDDSRGNTNTRSSNMYYSNREA